MSIILYARKSVERENSISCETQLEYCKMMIKPDEHREKLIELVDNGFSGGNVNRDGFQTMMKLVRQRKVKKVIVYKLDRISRSLADFVNIMQEFKEYGVEFVSSQEAFDTSSPYGELIMKILMVFAEFERTSIINRVTQAYHHRSELGFYMGGRRPYGFELIPTTIHNKPSKKLHPIPAESEQLRYIFEVYGLENLSLRALQSRLLDEEIHPLDGSHWTTAKLSAILKNPIYVKADADVYDYFERHGVQMISAVSQFSGNFGAQLYGRTKHKADDTDWSEMKLVLLSHEGIIDSDIWLRCQRKLEKNRQIGRSSSNPTSWLAGKVVCEKCKHSMTTIKGKANQNGELRRYFNCTGKSHKKICSGPKCTVYVEDLEQMIDDCITEKLTEILKETHITNVQDPAEINDLKLKIKSIEQSEKQLTDSLLLGSLNTDMVALLNQRASQLKEKKRLLEIRLEQIRSAQKECGNPIDFAHSWKHANYERKKAVASILVHQILISEDGSTKVIWNI